MIERLTTLGRLFKGVAGPGEKSDPLASVQPGVQVQLDITPFVLAGSAIATPMPPATTVVTAITRVHTFSAEWRRIYLGEHFIQLDLGEGGMIRECRYFSKFDEITPATPTDWNFWLADEDGYIGFNLFQIPDGREYPRFWMPGEGRVRPLELSEQVERGSLGYGGGRNHQAMLYARKTGVEDPCPAVEYLMLAAVRAGDQAWVQIHTGIDLNPQVLNFL